MAFPPFPFPCTTLVAAAAALLAATAADDAAAADADETADPAASRAALADDGTADETGAAAGGGAGFLAASMTSLTCWPVRVSLSSSAAASACSSAEWWVSRRRALFCAVSRSFFTCGGKRRIGETQWEIGRVKGRGIMPLSTSMPLNTRVWCLRDWGHDCVQDVL